jgi:hypothetical protein
MEHSQFFLRHLSKIFKGSKAALLWAALLSISWRIEAVELSMRDTSFTFPDTLRIALLVDSIPEAEGVLSYQFVITFDSDVLIGVGASATGTLSESFGDPFTSGDLYPGELRVAAAGIHPISGSGALITLLLRCLATGGVSDLRFSSVLLNEGSPPVTYQDPLATITAHGPGGAVGPTHVPTGEMQISVTPNPTTGRLVISVPHNVARSKIHVWNLLGQEVQSFEIRSSISEAHMGELPNGTYIVTADAFPKWSSRVVLLR